MAASWNLNAALAQTTANYNAALKRRDPHANADYRVQAAAVRAAWTAGESCPIAVSPEAAPVAGPLAPSTPDRTHVGLGKDHGINLAGQTWVVQSGTADGVSLRSDGSVRFHAKTGEYDAEYDPPRKIRAELCGQRRYAKGEEVHLTGRFTVDPATALTGMLAGERATVEWCSILQIHPADPRYPDGSPLNVSPIFSMELYLDAARKIGLRVRGETGMGIPAKGTFPYHMRVLGALPNLTLGAEHAFELRFVDGHGGPGRISLWIDGAAMCDRSNIATGYEAVDLMKANPVGCYAKFGVYSGMGSGPAAPDGVFIGYTFRGLSA